VEIILQNVVIAGVAIGVLSVVSNAWLKRRLEPVWVDVMRGGASLDSYEALLRQPARIARFSVRLWLLSAVLSPVDDVVAGNYRAAGAEFVGIVLGSLASSALVYLLTERCLRPLFRKALGSERPPAVKALGVRSRLLVAWALGSGIPLLGIAATPVVRTGSIPAVYGMCFLAVAGLGVGSGMTIAMARSVADPLDEVVATMAKIEEGDLAVEVAIDNAGDIGRLQAGLNRMAAGLRERVELEDLFGRHVGVEVARAAIARGNELRGETRDVTVLFVDLVGSTAATSTSAPADAVALANSFFHEVVDVVTACGGWVNKFQGDGAMCVFGAPAADPLHVAHALRAAEELNRRLRNSRLDAAIGVASGDVVAGNVGTRDRFEYTVMGATVNKAARLCDAAKQHESRTLAAVGSEQDRPSGWIPVPDLTLRGFPTAVPAWELSEGTHGNLDA
jgi:adenylate cyclase